MRREKNDEALTTSLDKIADWSVLAGKSMHAMATGVSWLEIHARSG